MRKTGCGFVTPGTVPSGARNPLIDYAETFPGGRNSMKNPAIFIAVNLIRLYGTATLAKPSARVKGRYSVHSHSHDAEINVSSSPTRRGAVFGACVRPAAPLPAAAAVSANCSVPATGAATAVPAAARV